MQGPINYTLYLIARFFYRFSPRGKAVLAEVVLRRSVRGWLVSVYGPKLRTNWSDATFRFCANGLYGEYFSGFLARLRSGFSFIDIGANLGLYSLIAARNPAVRRIHAFEPNPFVHESLLANAALNRVELVAHQLAISSQEGEQLFSFDADHTGVGGLGNAAGRHIKVRCRDFSIFDEIQAIDPAPKVVKIDVEGHEPVVIEQLLKSKMAGSIQFLYFEANETRYAVEELKATLQKSGFRLLHRTASGQHYDLMYERSESNGA